MPTLSKIISKSAAAVMDAIVPASPATLAERLGAARQELAQHEAGEGALALAVEEGAAGAEKPLAAHAERTQQLRAKVNRLTLAHGAAVEREAQRRGIAEAVQYANETAEILRHLGARDLHGAKLAAALSEVAQHYAAMITASAAALKVGPALPDGAMVAEGELRRAYEEEMHRLSAPDNMAASRATTLPGAKVYDHRLTHNPSAVRPLTDRLAEATQLVEATRNGRPLNNAAADLLGSN